MNETLTERCFVFVKPEHFSRASEVMGYFNSVLQNYGGVIFYKTVDEVPEKIADAHYALHRGKIKQGVNIHQALVGQLTGKPVTLAVYEGNPGLTKRIIELVGHRDPAIARQQKFIEENGKPVETIRGKFSDPEESEARALAERYATANVMHRADSIISTLRELRVWAQFLKEYSRWPAGEALVLNLLENLEFPSREFCALLEGYSPQRMRQ